MTNDAPFPEAMLPNIEEFFQSEHTREEGLNLYEDVFDTNLFFPLQRKRELVKMVEEARQVRPYTIMEIGTDKGGGFYHWCKCFPEAINLIACEYRGLPYAEEFEAAFPGKDFFWMEGSSRDKNNLTDLEDWLRGEKIDVLFIDGEKTCFKQDFLTYLPLMNPEGIVFMHDVHEDSSPMREAFEYVCKRYNYRNKIILDNSEVREAAKKDPETERVTPYEHWLRYWMGRSCGVGVIYLGE